jgi:hypothetical protein
MLETIAAQVAAIDELVGLARRSIRVFDVDLSDTGWNSLARNEALAAFLGQSRHARLDIIVHDTHYIERSCARLRKLQRLHSGSIAIFRTGAQARHAMDPIALVDDRHYLHRFNHEQPRAALGIDQPRAAQALKLRLDDIWATREDELPGTTLGL